MIWKFNLSNQSRRKIKNHRPQLKSNLLSLKQLTRLKINLQLRIKRRKRRFLNRLYSSNNRLKLKRNLRPQSLNKIQSKQSHKFQHKYLPSPQRIRPSKSLINFRNQSNQQSSLRQKRILMLSLMMITKKISSD